MQQVTPIFTLFFNPTKLCFILDGLSHDAVTWSEYDVATWLNHCNLGQYVAIFQSTVNLEMSNV
jgi:hypothetical protein